MIKSLVNFSDLDLIFKVTIRHKLKYLSKIMTSVPNLLNQTVNFIWIYMNIFIGQDNELIGDLDLFALTPIRQEKKKIFDPKLMKLFDCSHLDIASKIFISVGDLDLH